MSFTGAAGSACTYTPFLHEGRSEPPGVRPWIMELVEVPGNVDGDFGLCAQQACVHGLVVGLGGAARWPEGRYHVACAASPVWRSETAALRFRAVRGRVSVELHGSHGRVRCHERRAR